MNFLKFFRELGAITSQVVKERGRAQTNDIWVMVLQGDAFYPVFGFENHAFELWPHGSTQLNLRRLLKLDSYRNFRHEREMVLPVLVKTRKGPDSKMLEVMRIALQGNLLILTAVPMAFGGEK